jgi:hypothetical protein
MKKNNVVAIKAENKTHCFSFKVDMLVHIIADNEENAKSQLDEKGGIVTKREVKLVNTTELYGEKE